MCGCMLVWCLDARLMLTAWCVMYGVRRWEPRLMLRVSRRAAQAPSPFSMRSGTIPTVLRHLCLPQQKERVSYILWMAYSRRSPLGETRENHMVTQRFWSCAIYLATSNSHASGIVWAHATTIWRQSIDKQAHEQDKQATCLCLNRSLVCFPGSKGQASLQNYLII